MEDFDFCWCSYIVILIAFGFGGLAVGFRDKASLRNLTVEGGGSLRHLLSIWKR